MVRAKRRSGVLSVRPRVEALEDRNLLAGNVLQTNLVSDLPGVAQFTDPNLVNPWGISESASTATKPGSAFWISDNGSGLSTLYNSTGTPQTLVVSIPTPGNPLGNTGSPTGTVFNTDGGAAGGFPVSNGTKSASAIFLFATEDGTIVGWNPGINPANSNAAKAGTFGIIAVDNSASAVYKGLAIATNANGQTLLYASNFRSGKIDVFNPDFSAATLPLGAFMDPKLPAGYAPFDIQVLGGKVYVTYAKQDAAKHDDVAGDGNGYVDVYNLDGSGEQRLVSRGPLNSPWGLAIAPASFGSLAGDLLVGNFGNGQINAFDLSGNFKGQLKDPDGAPIQIPGLWSLKVGNDGQGGSSSVVYFTAGLDHEMHGLFGSLTPVAQGTPEGPAEAQLVQAEADIVQLDVTQVTQDIANGVKGKALEQDIKTLQTDLQTLIVAEIKLAADTHEDMHSGHNNSHCDHDDIFADFRWFEQAWR